MVESKALIFENMEITTRYSVGDKVCFMFNNEPADGKIIGIDVYATSIYRSNPTTMKESAEVRKVLYHIHIYHKETNMVTKEEREIFESMMEMRDYLFG